jgi:tetratricopeptide (TPR) repeat protein
MNDSAGYAISGCNPAALDAIEQAMHEFRCLKGNPVATLDVALAASPDAVMAHVLRAWLHLLGCEAGNVPIGRAALAAALALPHNEREAMHLAAIEQLCRNRWQAAGQLLEDLSVRYPLDAVALQAGHQIDFFRGDSRMLRDRIARALPAWSEASTGWHAVLGMYAFGLEETGDYALAERHGRRAVELEPADAWAQHAVAHVMEMQGRRDEGVAWMRGNMGWQRDSFLATHNWWHVALYHLANDDHDATLALLDGPIDGHKSSLQLELLDASSLLWRLRLRGVDAAHRWHSLAERWAPSARDGYYAFNDMHAAMAFACAGRDDLLDELERTQCEAIARDDDNAMFTREIGRDATRAIRAHVDGRHARAVEWLRPIRNRADRFGGSHAQRDVIDLTLIHAAHASGQHALARALEEERKSLAAQRSVRATLQAD